MANKFKKSLQTMEQNTNPENQGGTEPSTPSVFDLSIDKPTITPAAPATPAEKPAEPTVALDTLPQAEVKEVTAGLALHVEGALNKISTKGVNGKTIGVYIRYKVLDKLDKICAEKDINRSQAISAILEEVLLK